MDGEQKSSRMCHMQEEVVYRRAGWKGTELGGKGQSWVERARAGWKGPELGEKGQPPKIVLYMQ